MRMVAAGSGGDGLSDPRIANEVIALVGDIPVSEIQVLYIGTATYDLDAPFLRQTGRFTDAGCSVRRLDVASCIPRVADMQSLVDASHIVLVSGGNTLYAVDRWKKIGVDKIIQKAVENDEIVIAGGSAGAICWFDGGHSDSGDPETFKSAMLGEVEFQGEGNKSWEYIRVDGLTFLPCLICPHYDRVQSNGVLRATDFEGMLSRHPGERGIGIDHWAALIIHDSKYRVVSLDDKEGSLLPDGHSFSPPKGRPAIWYIDVINGIHHRHVVPSTGNVTDLLRPASFITIDRRVAAVRSLNPDTFGFRVSDND